MKAEYVMVGGFLGAGKTTALLRLAEDLSAQGKRVGLITNDQSSGLVDTTLVDAHGFPVEEITGGCFCCRFSSLTAAAERLTASARPDVFLAEPVGSCTDLRATVQYPLHRLYGDDYRIAPLSVLVDPLRALRVLGVEPGGAFSSKVRYVYRMQLEEADFIVINKADLLEPSRALALERALRNEYPHAEVFTVSARTGAGLNRWFGRIGAEPDTRAAPAVDYDEYAAGEALLGWCNATFQLTGAQPFDGNALVGALAREIRTALRAAGIEIAHCKMTLAPTEDGNDLAALNLVSSEREPELSHALADTLSTGELIVNLRGEGDPAVLQRSVADALASVTAAHHVRADTVHMEHFRPSRPVPTHRLATVH
jgi:G3E family GTPase